MFNWLTFLVFCVTTTYTPGPNPILSMNYGRLVGFRKTLPFIFGIFTSFTLLMILISFFMKTLELWIPALTSVLRFFGAGYILYLAWKTVVSTTNFNKEAKTGNLYRKGLLLQFINPKVYLYGITAISGFILPYFSKERDLVFFSILLAAIALVGNMLWAFFGVLFQKVFSKHEKSLRIIMGILLVYCAYMILRV